MVKYLCQFYNLHMYVYQRWNIGKDWFSWDIPQYRSISGESQLNFHFLPHFNSKTAKRIFTIFSDDVKLLSSFTQGDIPFHFRER